MTIEPENSLLLRCYSLLFSSFKMGRFLQSIAGQTLTRNYPSFVSADLKNSLFFSLLMKCPLEVRQYENSLVAVRAGRQSSELKGFSPRLNRLRLR